MQLESIIYHKGIFCNLLFYASNNDLKMLGKTDLCQELVVRLLHSPDCFWFESLPWKW